MVSQLYIQLKSNKSMATYFHGNSSSQIQPPAAGVGVGEEGLQTLIFMNPNPTATATADYNNSNVGGYSDSTTQPPPVATNFVFLNCDTPGGGGGNSFNASQPHHQQLLGIPLASAATSSEEYHQNHISLLHGFLPRFQYNNNLYNNNNQKVVDHMEAHETPRAQRERGLTSLSLSSQLPAANRELPPPSTLIDDMMVSVAGGGGAAGVYSSPLGISNGVNNNGMQNHHVFQSSKYLRSAQQLLDELVNVGDSVIKRENFDRIGKVEQPPRNAGDGGGGGGGGGSGCEKGGKRGGDELTTTEKQEIQMKKAKLVNMLDEVEQRYRHYHQQMQMVATMFEEAGGIGSAKVYTALALQTISKHFRSIKDAILCQVRIASKSLEEEEEDEDSNLVGDGNNNNNNNIKGPSSSSSRMKNIDNQVRQQRALQQLGMVHHNAWRPQRGLPERSVSVLRSWLFQHFLHPYPKDSDKIMLAKQAGLTRGQVSNWFINARVRLWKPMVEEMYSEEMKQQEKNGSEEKSSKNDEQINNEDSVFKTTPPDHHKTTTSTMEYQNKGYDVLNQDFPINNITSSPVSMSSTSPARIYMHNHQTGNFGLIESPEMESISNASPKKQRCTDDSDNEHLSMKFDTEKQRREDGFTFLGGHTTHFNINGGGFNIYPIAEHQFPLQYSGINGVSLSLGLPHCENLAMSGPHQTFLSNQNIELAQGLEETGDAREFGSIPHRVIVPEYMRESTFRNTRGLMDNNYYQTL